MAVRTLVLSLPTAADSVNLACCLALLPLVSSITLIQSKSTHYLSVPRFSYVFLFTTAAIVSVLITLALKGCDNSVKVAVLDVLHCAENEDESVLEYPVVDVLGLLSS